MQVFGRYLNPGEFDRLDETEQNQRSDEMMDIIRKRLEDRREDELRNKNPAS